MTPMNNAQMALLMQINQMQQIQQMHQINNILQSTMSANSQYQQQQQIVISDDEGSEDEEVLKTLFVANLEERVDEELLYELFLQAGPLERVHIPKNRPFAFVTYVHTCSPIYAMHLFHGLSLYGKQLTIKYKNTTNPPPLVNRLLPPEWGTMDNRNLNGQIQRNFDNAVIRNPFSGNGDNSFRMDSGYNRDVSPNERKYDARDRGPRNRNDRAHTQSNNNRRADSSRDRERERERDRHHDDRRSNNRHNDQRGGYYS